MTATRGAPGRKLRRGDDRPRVDVRGPRAVRADARQQAVARFLDEALVGRGGEAHAERLRHVDDQCAGGAAAAAAHHLDAAGRFDLVARRGRGKNGRGGGRRGRGGRRRRGRRLFDARHGERLAAASIVGLHDRERGDADGRDREPQGEARSETLGERRREEGASGVCPRGSFTSSRTPGPNPFSRPSRGPAPNHAFSARHCRLVRPSGRAEFSRGIFASPRLAPAPLRGEGKSVQSGPGPGYNAIYSNRRGRAGPARTFPAGKEGFQIDG